jgi:hypothetical protein
MVEEGVEFREGKPVRYGDIIKREIKENRVKREFENVGVVIYDQEAINYNKRFITGGRSAIAESELAIADSNSAIDHSVRNFDETVQYVKNQITQLDGRQQIDERTISKDLTL